MTLASHPRVDRRSFSLALTSLAFGGLLNSGCAIGPGADAAIGYGPLRPDPAGLLDLPPGFSYRIISALGDPMDDGFRVPDRADGMGAFAVAGGRIALVRNHELGPAHGAEGPFRGSAPVAGGYDRGVDGEWLPGGTTTLIYDPASGRVERQHLSLVGTIRNCAGGTTPWGSWLSCEEDVTPAGDGVDRDHGFVFEVPAAQSGLVDAVPLTALGRFNHEAAVVDPRTGIVYLTEDRHDGLFYRLLPNRAGRLREGGRLQALGYADRAREPDARNWRRTDLAAGDWAAVRWIDLAGVDSANDDLRLRGAQAGAVTFARGEGIWFGANELYFTCTNGGAARLSQVMRYRPSRDEGREAETEAPGRLQNFVESTDRAMLHFGDNITISPQGHLIICEDQAGDAVDNYLRGITPDGRVYAFARIRIQTEPAGACFSPDGATMFLNLYSPTRTLAIRGPWGIVAA